MKKIIATIAIALTLGLIGSQAASAHWGGYGPMHWGSDNSATEQTRTANDFGMGYGRMGYGMPGFNRMGYGMRGYGRMGYGPGMMGNGYGPGMTGHGYGPGSHMAGYGYGPGTCWTTSGPNN